MEEGHSIWQFQDTDREGYPKAIRVPLKSGRGVPDRAFYSAPVLRHVLVTHGIAQIGAAAWQSCHQLQIVRLPYSVTYLQCFSRLLRTQTNHYSWVCPIRKESLCGMLLPE